MSENKFKHTEIGMVPKEWEVNELKDVVEINKESRDPTREFPDKKFFYIDIDSIENGRGIIRSAKTMIGEKAPSRARRLIHHNDVIMSTVRPYLKAFAIVPREYDNQICSTGFAVLTCKEKILPLYLLYTLFSKPVIEQCNKMMVGGQYPALNNSQVEKIEIPFPPLPEQKKIAEILSTVDKAIEKVDEAIEKTQRLKKGLMEELFTKGITFGFMFDTNIFGAILDEKIDLEHLPLKFNYYVTNIQEDEIKGINKPEKKDRKNKLLEIFEEIKQERIPTEGFVLGISTFGAKFGRSILSKELLLRLQDLDKKSPKKKTEANQERDVLIAEACIKNNLILISKDTNLRTVVQEFKGQAITFEQFLKGEYKEFKDTEIGRIPKEWKVVSLGEIADINRGKFAHRPRNEPRFYGGKIPFIQTGDISEANGVIKKYSQTLNEEGLKISKLFKKGTIVISIAGNIGDVGTLDFDACFPDSVVGINSDSQKANQLFLMYLLQEFKYKLSSTAPRSTQKNINLEILQPLKLPLPPLPEQKKIAGILSTVDRRLELLRKKKERLERVKKGLMNDLLSGRKRVKV